MTLGTAVDTLVRRDKMQIILNSIAWNICFEGDGENVYMDKDGEDRWGLCVYANHSIYIHKELTEVNMKRTITHELVHAFLFSFYGKTEIMMDDEDLADFISSYIEELSFCSDNIFHIWLEKNGKKSKKKGHK